MCGAVDLDALTTREARRVTGRLISRTTRFRGRARRDDRLTLLTVNYGSRSDTERLVASFRRFVSKDWPVVVVQNSGWPWGWQIPARVVGIGRNLHHGLGLDFGMRFVSTEYTLICDPDSMIVGDLWTTIRPLLHQYGIAGIDFTAPYYHPICVVFRTEAWKMTSVSLREDWSRGFDVARALTPLFGGLNPSALLSRTRCAGPPIYSWEETRGHYVAEVYADVVSNTLGGTRAREGPSAFAPEEGAYGRIVSCQNAWRSWADAYLAGAATLDDFPVCG